MRGRKRDSSIGCPSGRNKLYYESSLELSLSNSKSSHVITPLIVVELLVWILVLVLLLFVVILIDAFWIDWFVRNNVCNNEFDNNDESGIYIGWDKLADDGIFFFDVSGVSGVSLEVYKPAFFLNLPWL